MLCVPPTEGAFFLRRESTWARLDLAGGDVDAPAAAREDARILSTGRVTTSRLQDLGYKTQDSTMHAIEGRRQE